MARARLIYRTLHASQKFNALCGQEHGELAQLVYLMSYPHADDWGHLPYEAEWVQLTCLGKNPHTTADVSCAMGLLVCGLWSEPYTINGKQYVYIEGFDVYQRDGIRHRRKGEWPDESGSIPHRTAQEDTITSLQKSAHIRAKHTVSRKVS